MTTDRQIVLDESTAIGDAIIEQLLLPASPRRIDRSGPDIEAANWDEDEWLKAPEAHGWEVESDVAKRYQIGLKRCKAAGVHRLSVAGVEIMWRALWTTSTPAKLIKLAGKAQSQHDRAVAAVADRQEAERQATENMWSNWRSAKPTRWMGAIQFQNNDGYLSLAVIDGTAFQVVSPTERKLPTEPSDDVKYQPVEVQISQTVGAGDLTKADWEKAGWNFIDRGPAAF